MSCTTETYAPAGVGARASLRLFDHAGAARPRVTAEEIRRARSLAPDGAQAPVSRVVPDTTKAEPEHIWGDEGPVNE
jgi:hypothetical protein